MGPPARFARLTRRSVWPFFVSIREDTPVSYQVKEGLSRRHITSVFYFLPQKTFRNQNLVGSDVAQTL